MVGRYSRVSNNRGDGIILSWVENERFNRPKTKKCITEGKIIFQKLISGVGWGYDY